MVIAPAHRATLVVAVAVLAIAVITVAIAIFAVAIFTVAVLAIAVITVAIAIFAVAIFTVAVFTVAVMAAVVRDAKLLAFNDEVGIFYAIGMGQQVDGDVIAVGDAGQVLASLDKVGVDALMIVVGVSTVMV